MLPINLYGERLWIMVCASLQKFLIQSPSDCLQPFISTRLSGFLKFLEIFGASFLVVYISEVSFLSHRDIGFPCSSSLGVCLHIYTFFFFFCKIPQQSCIRGNGRCCRSELIVMLRGVTTHFRSSQVYSIMRSIIIRARFPTKRVVPEFAGL